ncbi:MAG TPA: N,N-dimethylformamidase beta subunit family domain-containing protein [Solirubrobacteraceae bacterium]|nr:N,N-dimethylformamidase beta subunit family domain-containing protein [Solirubrobacteraceae bacterium]
MLSGPPRSARVELLRLIHGDPNPAGPGIRAERPAWAPREQLVPLPRQVTDFGSYLEVPDAPSLRPAGSFTLAVWFCPTLLHGGWQTLAVKGYAGDFGYGLYCGGHRLLAAAVSVDGRRIEWCAGAGYVSPRAWQLVALTYAAETRQLTVWQWVDAAGREHSRPLAQANDSVVSTRTLTGAADHGSAAPLALHGSAAPLLFGASQVVPRSRHAGHFNGKLARPLLVGAAVSASDLGRLAAGEDPTNLGPVLGHWDLSKSVTNAVVQDVSVHGNDGVAVNAPGRAVTGPSWRGNPGFLFSEKPEWYDAVHLHDDDLDDARWEPAVELDIPPTARSGIYALRVHCDEDEAHVPIVVRPASALADVAILVPTLTWQAYGSNQFPWSFGEDGVLDRGVSLYNAHSDGSEVYYVTRRKPTRAWSPSQGIRLWGAHLVTAALYLVDGLEHKNFAFDALTDEDLHREGQDLLSAYRCLILGSHPEYWTGAMLGALRDYTRSGGRVLYLGGNGLYWVTSIDAERSFLMEVRKSGEGSYDERWIKPEPGEYQHSTTLETGGMWARRGFPPRSVVGVEHGANVFGSSTERWGFRRLDASRHDRFSFVFENVDDEVIGDFGLNLGSAAGYEMDRAQEWCPSSDEELVVLARATHANFVSPKRLPVQPAADMTLLSLPGGGAVFAAGSVTWTGSLSHNGYENNVSAVTENVLRRFRDCPPGTPVAPSRQIER